MGIFGAVLATGFAPLISQGILFHWLIMKVASGIVMIVFNAVIMKLQGNIGVAAYGGVANISLVVTSVYTGIAQGIGNQ